MHKLQTLRGLPARDRWLLAQAAGLLCGARLGLRLLPFRQLRRLAGGAARPGRAERVRNPVSAERIIWAVRVASRYVAGATCLPQALAAQVLLGRQGYPTRLRIGVVKSADGRLEAHAWVEHEGAVLIGGSAEGLALFTPLSLPEDDRS